MSILLISLQHLFDIKLLLHFQCVPNDIVYLTVYISFTTLQIIFPFTNYFRTNKFPSLRCIFEKCIQNMSGKAIEIHKCSEF